MDGDFHSHLLSLSLPLSFPYYTDRYTLFASIPPTGQKTRRGGRVGALIITNGAQ